MTPVLDLRRTVAALVSVALSATLICFAFIASASFRSQLTADARGSVGSADVVVLPPRGSLLSTETVQAVSSAAGVSSVRQYVEEHVVVDRPGVGQDEHAVMLDSSNAESTLTAGRLPEGPGEVAVSQTLAQGGGLEVGDSLALKASPSSASSTTAQIVGVIQPTAALTRENLQDFFILATGEERQALGLGSLPAVLYVNAQDGTSVNDLMASVRGAAHDADVYTADEIVTVRAANGRSGVSATLLLLRVLGPVCAVVAAIVIATTFTTLVARQTRQTGLLRCIGASRRQVRLTVLRTALTAGLGGSVVGTMIGAGAAIALTRSGAVDGLESRYLTITPLSLVSSVVISTLVALVAALRPASRAAKVSPLVALTGKVADDHALSRRRTVAAVLGALLVLAGAFLIGAAVRKGSIEATALGAVVLLLGILAALPLLVVGVAHLVARAAGADRRPIVHLAARNLSRNPGRAAATTAALLVSVSVAAALVTGLATVKSSLEDYLASTNPIDVTIQGVSPHDDAETITSKVTAVDGVMSAVLVPDLTVEASSSAQAEDSLEVQAIDKDAVSGVIRSSEGLEALGDDSLIVSEAYQLPEGTTVTLTGPAGSATLTAHVSEGFGAAVTPAVAHQLMGDTPTASVLWARTAGDGSDPQPARQLRETLRGSGLAVSTSIDGRQAVTDTIRRTSLVTTAVLVLTMLITLSGLANTMDVAALERTREIGVMRATGTARPQVRRLFLAEATLTALLGGILGLTVGAAIGVAGVAALMGPQGLSYLSPSAPWLHIIGVLITAAAVGALAAHRPAARAAAIPPVAALATD